MFGDGFEELHSDPDTDYVKEIWEEVEPFFEREGNTVIVSAEVMKDGFTYDPGTDRYREVLAAINNKLAHAADLFVEVVCGIPIVLKGSLDFLNE